MNFFHFFAEEVKLKEAMKYWSIFLVFTWSLYAQGFEGIIEYKIEVKGAMAEAMKGMMPTKSTMYVKGDKVKFVTEGGAITALGGANQYIVKDNKMYMINSVNKTAQVMDLNQAEQMQKEQEDKVKVTPLNEWETIAGYKCRKYKAVIKHPTMGEIVQWVWATPDIQLKLSGEAAKHINQMKGVDGVVLKTIQEMPAMGITSITEATKVTKKSLDDSIFEIPKDYKVEQLNLETLPKE